MQNYVAALIACGLVGVAVAYCEIKQWGGLARVASFAGCGVVASLFAASPVMWQLLGLYSGAVEQIAMAVALAAGLWVMVDQIKGWV
jgi:uncharacterized membrane protein